MKPGLVDDWVNTEAEEADTMQTRRTIRKPDMLFVLTLLTGLGVLASTTAVAEESIFSNVNLFRNVQLEDLRDGDLRMVGDRNTGLHLSARSQSQSARYIGQHDGHATSDTGVHMSWKLAW
jgi:hypothetical protein